jgi:hypothetical protein
MKNIIKAPPQYLFAGVAIALLFPSIALADAGTPLMWLEFFHLVFANAIIGVCEGLIIAMVFKTSFRRTIVILIFANYFSMIVGVAGVTYFLDEIRKAVLGSEPLYNAPKFIWLMAIGSYILTIILEWPFCLWALSRTPNCFRKSFIASPLVQTASYAVLALLYYVVSFANIYSHVAIDRALTFPDTQKYWIYFISPDDGNVYRIHPDASSCTKICDSRITYKDWAPQLFAIPSSEPNNYDLWTSDVPEKNKNKCLLKGFATKTVLSKIPRYESEVIIAEPNVINHSNVILGLSITDFRDPNNIQWSVRNGWWALEGLHCENKAKKQDLWLAFETPFLAWETRSPIILPGDYVIYQLGDQIVLLDINNRKIRLVAIGRGPVVTMD